jgi:hypothetical protein
MQHLPSCRFPLYLLHTRPQYERATNLPRFIRVVPRFLAAADEDGETAQLHDIVHDLTSEPPR